MRAISRPSGRQANLALDLRGRDGPDVALARRAAADRRARERHARQPDRSIRGRAEPLRPAPLRRCVLVAGEAGSGKTTRIDGELSQRARGHVLRVGRCAFGHRRGGSGWGVPGHRRGRLGQCSCGRLAPAAAPPAAAAAADPAPAVPAVGAGAVARGAPGSADARPRWGSSSTSPPPSTPPCSAATRTLRPHAAQPVHAGASEGCR